jgi:hypothetical protein
MEDADNALPPPDLVGAVAALWRLDPPGSHNLFSAPAFVRLRETCQKLYPKAGSRDALNSALSNALRLLGWPTGLAPHHADLALPAEVAAARLDGAFRRLQSTRVHLCPLDCADELPTLSFGPNRVQRMSAAELERLVDPRRLKRFNPTWTFDAERFSEFSWLVVNEVVPLDGEPGARALPSLFPLDLNRDAGALEPHQRRYATVVEAALFALLLAPWEDWAVYRDLDWRAFRVPWIYTIDYDIFAGTLPPPSPETLSWQPDFFVDDYGEAIELERPIRLPLSDCAAKALEWLNDAAWADLIRARESSLFGTPVEHFLVRGYLADGIDEFLAHITVVEAALGMSIDHYRHSRPKIGSKDPGATARVAARLSALLGSNTAGDDFKQLFGTRSDFLHGRTMSPISSQDRILARRLAREAVVALVRAALARSVPSSRDAYLDDLLDTGFNLA